METQNDLRAKVQLFGAIARNYCELVEYPVNIDRETWMELVHGALAALYSARFELPESGPLSNDDSEREIDDERYWIVFNHLRSYLGEYDVYVTVWDPYQDKVGIHGHLSGDPAHIWRDMSEGLLMLDRNVHPYDVIFEWKLGFDTHWGRHVVHALQAIHSIRFS